uniref:Uncharacterized protein n=1 Tax=Anguilla anguilla TaxID=7936 RepID=A0A0E9X3D1_ANGAN
MSTSDTQAHTHTHRQLTGHQTNAEQILLQNTENILMCVRDASGQQRQSKRRSDKSTSHSTPPPPPSQQYVCSCLYNRGTEL